MFHFCLWSYYKNTNRSSDKPDLKVDLLNAKLLSIAADQMDVIDWCLMQAWMQEKKKKQIYRKVICIVGMIKVHCNPLVEEAAMELQKTII